MSIEFGVLREGSTITLLGSLRVTVDEDIFDELEKVFSKIQARTGKEIDKYGSTCFDGEALHIFIDELESANSARTAYSESLYETLQELLGVACYAKENNKPLSYFGQ